MWRLLPSRRRASTSSLQGRREADGKITLSLWTRSNALSPLLGSLEVCSRAVSASVALRCIASRDACTRQFVSITLWVEGIFRQELTASYTSSNHGFVDRLCYSTAVSRREQTAIYKWDRLSRMRRVVIILARMSYLAWLELLPMDRKLLLN